MSKNRQEFIGSNEPKNVQEGAKLEKQTKEKSTGISIDVSTILLLLLIIVPSTYMIGYMTGRRVQSQYEQQFIKVEDGLQEIDTNKLKQDSSYTLKLLSNVERNNANAHIKNTITCDVIAVENARVTLDRVTDIYNNMPKDSQYYEEIKQMLEDHEEVLEELEEKLEYMHELEKSLESANKADDFLNTIP